MFPMIFLVLVYRCCAKKKNPGKHWFLSNRLTQVLIIGYSRQRSKMFFINFHQKSLFKTLNYKCNVNARENTGYLSHLKSFFGKRTFTYKCGVCHFRHIHNTLLYSEILYRRLTYYKTKLPFCLSSQYEIILLMILLTF